MLDWIWKLFYKTTNDPSSKPSSASSLDVMELVTEAAHNAELRDNIQEGQKMTDKRHVLQLNGLYDIHDEEYFRRLLPYVLHVWIARNTVTLEPQGYGFLEFESAQDMSSAVNEMRTILPYVRYYVI